MRPRRTFGCMAIALALVSAPEVGASGQAGDSGRGVVASRKVRAGSLWEFVPRKEATGVLVVVHGQPAGADIGDIPGLARRFIERWVGFGEEHGLIVVAPVFNAEDFDSVEGKHGGGYRGLFGRDFGADEFIAQAVGPYKARIKGWDGRILLYGHSAGAQFANRYCVIHPERIRAAVIGSAGGFAYPDRAERWPNGMGPWQTSFRWEGRPSGQPIDVRPDPLGWVKAASLPILVMVGAEDTEPQKPRAGHVGTTRIEYAERWASAMNEVARRRKKPGTVKFEVVPGVGHDSARLTPTARRFLGDFLRADAAGRE